MTFKDVLKTTAFTGTVLLGTACGALAQDGNGGLGAPVTLSAGVSTLGLFVEPSYRVNDRLNLRLPVFGGSYSGTIDLEDDNSVDGDFKAKSVALLAEFHPGARGFFLTGGVAFGGYELNGTTDEIHAEGQTFSGDFQVKGDQKQSVAPQLGLGYRYDAAGGLTAMVELGARIATYKVSVSGIDDLPESEQDDIKKEFQDINDTLDDFGVVPYLSLSVGWRF